ncbi:WD-40 repeat protein [Salpingoeca rosetta]|uniref:WD-40 repeat protein n=1 Tax=Salpingoeca rosetta (strain ATCC 50818 / BSB-021) TaxID=946362 RepID=F2U270_SALR5|nr:WD-40 repeat protein [Salpingoeca rosetta]EGD81722.1 WD-40 repeat protein [Salpingoeca rosetta]|eukprot:XP_004996926.1 WD-40 repeat protein [Salpingoeca rosetta]
MGRRRSGLGRVRDLRSNMELEPLNTNNGGSSTTTWMEDPPGFSDDGDDMTRSSSSGSAEQYVPAKKQLTEHTKPVHALEFASDGRTIISASADTLAKIWDLPSGKCLHTLTGHTDAVTCAAISQNVKFAVTGSKDGTARVWNVETGACETVIKQANTAGRAVLSINITPDAKHVILGSNTGTVSIHERQGGALVAKLEGHAEAVLGIAVSPNGAFIISSSEDKTIRVWDADTTVCLRKMTGHGGSVNAVVVSPDGQFIVSGSKDETIKVWSLATGDCLRSMKGHVDDIYDVAITHDGLFVVSASNDDTVRVWSFHTGACLQVLRGHTDVVLSVAVSPGGWHIVSGGGTKLHLKDTSVRVWSLATGARQRVLHGHTASVKAVAVSQRSDLVVSASNDGTAKVWDLATGACVHTFDGHTDYVRGVALSPDDSFTVTGSCDTTVRVWDNATGACIKVLEGHTFTVAALAVAANSKTIASGGWDSTIKLWSWPDGACTHTLQGHGGKILALSLGPTPTTLLSASEDCTVKMWEMNTGRCSLTLEGHTDAVNGAVATPDGKFVVSGSDDGSLVLWDLDMGGAPVRKLLGHAGRVYSVDVSRDGKYLLSGSWDKTAKVWDLQSGECLRTFGEHGDRVRCGVLKGSDVVVLAVGSKARCATLNLCFDYPTVAYNKEANMDGFLTDTDQHVDAYSLSFVQPLLAEGARQGRVDNIASLTDRNPPIAIDFRSLLSAALDSHAEDAVRLVVDLIIQAIRHTLRGEPGLFWSPEVNHSIHIELARLVQRFPSLVEVLMTSCPLVPSSAAAISFFSVSEFVGSEQDNAGYMEFCPCDYLDYPAWSRMQAKESTTRVELRPVLPRPPTALRRKKTVTRNSLTTPPLLDPDDAGHQQAMTTVENLVLPFPDLAGSEACGVDFLHELLRTGRSDTFAGIVPQMLVEYRWRCFGQRIHLRNLLVYMVALALFVTMGFLGQYLEGTSVTDFNEGRRDEAKPAAIVVGACLLAVTTYHAVREIRQAWMERAGLYYLKSVWNWLDMLRIIMSYVGVIALFVDAHKTSRFFFAIGSYVFWFGILFFLQAFSSTGPLVRMVIEIMVGMRWFLLVLGIALLATANVFVLLVEETPAPNGYEDVADVLLTMFRLLMLSDLELLNFSAGSYTIPLKLVWVLTMILVPIVLLNLLIALMSDSYELIQDKAVVEFQRLRAQIIREQEIFFDRSAFQRKDWYPRFLHVLLPRGRNTGGADSSQWQGVLHALRGDMHELATTTNERIDATEAKVDRLLEKVNSANERLTQQLNDIRLLLHRPSTRAPRT